MRTVQWQNFQRGSTLLQVTLQEQNTEDSEEEILFSINDYGEDHSTYDLPDENYRPDVITDSGIKDEIIQKALNESKRNIQRSSDISEIFRD